MDDGCYAQMCDTFLTNKAYEGLAENLAKITACCLKEPNLIQPMLRSKGVECQIAMIENYPLNEGLIALAAENIGKFAIDRPKIAKDMISSGAGDALFKAIEQLIGDTDKELVLSLIATEMLAKNTENASWVNDNQLQLLKEAMKKKEEPSVVQQALKTIQAFCENDSEFCKRFIASDGLTALMKNMDVFSQNPHIIEPSMAILSECTKVANANELTKANVIQSVLDAMRGNENYASILSSGVTTLGALAMFGTLNTDLLKPSTLATVTTAMTARVADPSMALAMAAFVKNLTGFPPDPATLQVLFFFLFFCFFF